MDTNTKLALSGLTVVVGESLVAATHAGGVGVIVALAAGVVAYNAIEDIEKATGRDLPSLPARHPSKRVPGKPSPVYRLLVGKSEREVTERDLQDDHDDFDLEDAKKDAFIFSKLLATGWRPSESQIFLAVLEDGASIFVSIEQLVHIALAGATRQGKTSIIRQLLAQLCSLGHVCVLLDPHYTPYDIETGEDWTPFSRHLRFDPLEYTSYDKIEQVLKYAATTMLPHRKTLRGQMKPVGKHVFLVIDEYPAILAEKPKVQEYVAKLLREGGKYKIHLVVASQDFQVKTVSPQSGGAIREQYGTCFYVGGDPTTARVLLDTTIEKSVEARLGKGPIYLRCETHKQATFAYTPWMDNEAVYTLLGPSTYEPEDADDIKTEFEDDHDPLADMHIDPDVVADAVKQEATIKPNIPDKRPKATDIDINILCACWNGGVNTVSKIETTFKMSHGEAYKAYKLIKAQRGEPIEEQE